MADISEIIAPKSDQLNSDDLAAGERTIRIRDVKVLGAGKEQPIWVYFDGDGNKPWKPCKTMARLLANLWKAPDTREWVGRAVTLYCDPAVTWGGAKVGGIRIKAVSHIDAPRQVAVSESKTRKKLTKIEVISADVREMMPAEDKAAKWADGYIAAIEACETMDDLIALENRQAQNVDRLKSSRPELHEIIQSASQARAAALSKEGKPDAETGEAFDPETGEF